MKAEDMPETVPVEHQAKSCGQLGTPHRNVKCVDCNGSGRSNSAYSIRISHGFMFEIVACKTCFGSGELTYDGKLVPIA